MSIRLPLAPLFAVLFTGSLLAQDERSSYHAKRDVKIPFNADEKGEIREIQLYTSLNGGDWKLVGQAHPNQKAFRFTTDKDGAYDFAVKTLYINGKSVPERTDDLKASRRIVIDTIPPQVTARAFGTSEKNAGVEWEATDENIDPKSVRLEYRWPGTREWRPIDRDRQFKAKDQSSWNLTGKGGSIEIRVRARDLAGNEGISEAVSTPPLGGTSGGALGGATARGDALQNSLPEPRDSDRLPPLKPYDSQPVRDPYDAGSSPAVKAGGGGSLVYVGGRRIQFEYDFKVGPSKYRDSELYVKKPSASDWEKVDFPNPPKPAPGTNTITFDYDAGADGVYSFFIRIQNGVEKWSDDVPGKLTPPRVEVMVDTAKPNVTLNPPKVRPAPDGLAVIDLSWLAEDRLSGLKPQSLKVEYAEKADGPWSLITDRQNGSGSYSWNVPEGISSVWLRVSAEDRAGNVGVYTATSPQIVDLQRPTVDNVKAGGIRVKGAGDER